MSNKRAKRDLTNPTQVAAWFACCLRKLSASRFSSAAPDSFAPFVPGQRNATIADLIKAFLSPFDAIYQSRWLAALGRGFLSLRPNEIAAKALRDGLSLLGDLDPEMARDTFCRAYRQYARAGIKAKDLEALVVVALMNCLDDDVASLNEIKSVVHSYGHWSDKFFAQEARI